MRAKSVILLGAFLSFSVPRLAAAGEAARVNGTAIPDGAVSLELAREPALRYHPNIAPEKLALYRNAALDRLIEQEVTYPEAVRQLVAPSPKEVAEGVAKAEKAMGSREKLLADLSKGGLSLADFENWIRKSLALEALSARVKADVKVSDSDVAGYYASHRAEYVQPEGVSAVLLYFPVAPYATTSEVEGVRGKAAAAAARWRTEKPADEQAFAAQVGAQFNNLGTVHKGAAVEGLDEALFSLPVGRVSDPVKTIYGYQLLLVKEKHAARQMALAEARDGIRAKLLEERSRKRYEQLKAELYAKARIEKLN